MRGESKETKLPRSWTHVIDTMLYEDGGSHWPHMSTIDINYRLMDISQGDSRPSPTEFVRRMRAVVQYILHPDDEANPEHLRQLIEDLGDHKQNEV